MIGKLFERPERKRNWGRSTRIDSWERLQLVVKLLKSNLPIDISMDLNDAEASRPLPLPLPYDPRAENSTMMPVALPLLAEVRVSLFVDETLGWMLPVQFCIDQLLTAEDVVTKLADALSFLKAWSQVHAQEGREHLRAQRLRSRPAANSATKYLIQ